MNMVRSLSAMEERIIMAKNVIAIIVVYFLIVSIFVFSHCKDRPYSRTLQVFSSLFASDIATLPAYGDKYWEHPLFLSRRPHIFLLHPSAFGIGFRRSAIVAGCRASSNSSDVPKVNRANPHDT